MKKVLILMMIFFNLSLYAAVTCSNFKKQSTCENHTECRWDTIILFIGTCTDNASPVANDDMAATFKNSSVTIDVTINDTDDVSINKTTVTIVDQPTNGIVSVNSTTGVVTYTSNSTFTGDTFTYTVKDNNGALSNTATVTITEILPIADYHLDECVWNGVAGEVKDSGPSGLHAIAINGATIDTGKVCKSGKFDGTNDYVDVGNVLNPLSSSWSVSVWFKWNGKGGDNIIYNKENLYEARVSGGYFQYAWMPHWNWDGGTSFPVTQDTWYHAVVTYDGITQKVYKDGVKVYERAQSGAIGTNTNKLLMGARGSGSPGSFFGGNIDEVQIFDMALTAEEITSLYSNESTGKNYNGTERVCSNCVSNINVIEGDSGTTNALFTLALGKPVSSLTTIDYATADGTATVANNDYNETHGTISFAAGEQTKTVTVTINGDLTFEQDETFKLILSNPTNGLSINSEVIGTIINDDIHFAADYHLDECVWNGVAGEVKDSGPSGLHAIAINGATIDTGKVCKSGKFDGTNDYVDVGNVLNPLSSSWSVSVWFKWNGKGGDNIIYNKENLYEARVSGGYFQYAWMPHWNWDGGTSFPVTQDTWYHAVVTYDGITQKVYKDGVKVYERAQSGAIGTNTNKLLMGARGSGSPGSFFGGNIDEVQIFDMALTAEKVMSLYNNEAAGKNYDGSGRTCSSCLIADYHLDECVWNGTSGEVKDSSGNNLNGTAFNGATTFSPGENGFYRDGNFTNSTDYVDLGHPDLGLGNALTVMGWINWQIPPSTGNSWSNILSYNSSTVSDSHPFVLQHSSNNSKYEFAVTTGTNTRKYVTSSISTQQNVWQHITGVYDGNTLKIYVNGSDASASTVTQTGTIMIPPANAKLEIGQWALSSSSRNFNGYLDEIKIFNGALTSIQINNIYNYEKDGKNYDGTPRDPIVCMPPVSPNCTTFTYNLYHPLSITNKLQTRIAQQAFDLNVTAACNSTGAIPSRKIKNIYAVSGTCPVATTGLPVLWTGSADINDTVKTITLSNLNSTKAYSNIKLMLETNASELNCSTDNFAIRPPSFNITSPLTSVAANTFTLQLSALNSGTGYNGTANVTTALQTPNANCPTASGFLKSSLGAAEPLSILFQSDTNSSQMKATDVGGIYLNVKDSNWTTVDQPASECVAGSNSTILNGQGLVGCNIDNNLSLTIKPDHFDLNATLSNAVTGFTYLSTDLNMSARLDLNVTAKTADGNTTKNYNSGCYAKPTNYTISYTAPTITPSANLTKLNYLETNTSTSGNVATTTNTFSLTALPKIIFGSDTNGSANLSIKLNFDRSNSLSVNPFDLNITSAVATDTDSVTGNDTTVGNATFVYGRVRAYNITTNEASAPNPVEFEVYSTTSSGYVSGMPQNVLKWYRNLNHDSTVEGNIIKGGFSAGANDVNVSTAVAPQNGIQNVTVTSSVDKTVHLDISSWLWYSLNPAKIYNYGTDCTQHPCFIYDYTDTTITSVKGVSSGTFGGTDFTMTPANNIIKKGVKVFR
ncbi:MAG: Calx-beta domain-containing protein [Sulfuricurvum sp.]|nr:Calx-beta domain-containing protein [Sulfuricurvum sp.]